MSVARSVLNRFVSGARQLLAVQLVIAVLAVALAGWTLGVTGNLIRERERLRERVAQLEETLVANDVVVPSNTTMVATPNQTPRDAYPPSTPGAGGATASEASGFNPAQIITDLFTPAPAMALIIVHVRGEAEARIVAPIVETLRQAGDVEVVVNQMAARESRPAGYAYFDGRQSGAAAAWMQRFHDSARSNEVAPWSAQLRGVALPAQGEYAANRMDIVLPALSPAQVLRLDPAQANAPPPAPPAAVNR